LTDRREAAHLEDRGLKQTNTGMARHKPTARLRRSTVDLEIAWASKSYTLPNFRMDN
jgi:hypothetical protein